MCQSIKKIRTHTLFLHPRILHDFTHYHTQKFKSRLLVTNENQHIESQTGFISELSLYTTEHKFRKEDVHLSFLVKSHSYLKPHTCTCSTIYSQYLCQFSNNHFSFLKVISLNFQSIIKMFCSVYKHNNDHLNQKNIKKKKLAQTYVQSKSSIMQKKII